MNISTQFMISWRMMAHRPNRFLFSILGVAFSVLIMFMELGFFNGLNDGQANLPPLMEADLVISHPQKGDLKSYTRIFRQVAYQVEQYPEVEATSDFRLRADFWQNPDNGLANRALILGVDLDDPMFNIPEIEQYREELRQPGTMLFDRKSRPELGDVKIGTVTAVGVRQEDAKVVGLFEMGPNFSYEGNIIMSSENFVNYCGRRAPGDVVDWVDLVFVRLKPGTDAQAIRKKMEREIPGEMAINTPRELFKREVIVTTKETPSGFVLGIGLIVGVVIGIIICYQILFNEVADNITQFATVKAIGHPPQFLAGIVLGCAVILGVFGFIIGLIGSFGIYALIEGLTQINMNLTLGRISLIFVMTTGMCVCAGYLALRKVLQADPADLF